MYRLQLRTERHTKQVPDSILTSIFDPEAYKVRFPRLQKSQAAAVPVLPSKKSRWDTIYRAFLESWLVSSGTKSPRNPVNKDRHSNTTAQSREKAGV